MANPENLIPAVKGEPSRNPNGRPKGSKNRATYLREILETKMVAIDPITKKEKRMPVEKILDLNLIGIALSSKATEAVRLRAIEVIKENVYGKLPQDLNLGGQDDNPVVIEEKVSNLTTLERLIVKYGVDSAQVVKYQEKYCTKENGDPEEKEEQETGD